MAHQATGGHEQRTRVICHLPVSNPENYQAVEAIFTYLETLRTKPLGVRGYTHSAVRPPAHFGAWWSSKRQLWMREKVILCLVDYKVNFDDPQFVQILAELKDTIREAYRATGKPQQEVWVVAHHVVR